MAQKNFKLPLIYEDDELLVLNKPAGLTVESESKKEMTLSKILAESLGVGHFFLVHRLDKETSGVLLVAKTKKMADYLKSLFKRRLMKKEYYAKVAGKLTPKLGEIDVPLKKVARLQKTLPAAGGVWAKTAYQVERYEDNASLVKVFPTTGRTHQIRAHLSLIGHPLVGDSRYGGPQGQRLFLHAKKITFKNLKGEKVSFEAPLPF